MTVEHPSGYRYLNHSGKFNTALVWNKATSTLDMNNDIRLYETSEDETTFYYSEMQNEKNVNVCMKFENNVGAPKPAALTIQDYYNPAAKLNTFYALEGRKVVDFWYNGHSK